MFLPEKSVRLKLAVFLFFFVFVIEFFADVVIQGIAFAAIIVLGVLVQHCAAASATST